MKHFLVCNSHPISIFVTGKGVKEACQAFCDDKGLCVSITETDYVFTGGSEKGFIIGLINYPRFPKTPGELWNIADDLGIYLMETCNPYGSFTIQDPDNTYFNSNRESD